MLETHILQFERLPTSISTGRSWISLASGCVKHRYNEVTKLTRIVSGHRENVQRYAQISLVLNEVVEAFRAFKR